MTTSSLIWVCSTRSGEENHRCHWVHNGLGLVWSQPHPGCEWAVLSTLRPKHLFFVWVTWAVWNSSEAVCCEWGSEDFTFNPQKGNKKLSYSGWVVLVASGSGWEILYFCDSLLYALKRLKKTTSTARMEVVAPDSSFIARAKSLSIFIQLFNNNQIRFKKGLTNTVWNTFSSPSYRGKGKWVLSHRQAMVQYESIGSLVVWMTWDLPHVKFFQKRN